MRDPSRERGAAEALRLVPPLMEPPASESLVAHSPCITFGSGGDGGSLPADGDVAYLDDGATRTRAAMPFKPSSAAPTASIKRSWSRRLTPR